MAFSCVKRDVFSILPLLVILSITPLSSSFSPTDKVTKALVNQVCSKPPIYKHFCVPWLTSDPKTFTVDLHGLLGMFIQKTQSLGNQNLATMKSLARITFDPKLRSPYKSCVTEYQTSIKALQGAKGFASSESYVLASKASFTALDSISTCEALLEGHTIPAYVSSRNLMFENMCTIDKVLSDLLTI